MIKKYILKNIMNYDSDLDGLVLKYIPDDVYVNLKKWYYRFSNKNKYNKYYIELHNQIENGHYSNLSVDDKRLLDKLFYSNIINKNNIKYYFINFNKIVPQSTLLKKIDEDLEANNKDSLKKLFEKLMLEVSDQEYFQIRNYYKIKEFEKNYISFLKEYKFADAEYILKKSNELIDPFQTKEYLKLLNKYKLEFNQIRIEKAWKEYMLLLEDNKFNEANKIINNNVDLLYAFEDRKYLEIKNKFMQKYNNYRVEKAWKEYMLLLEDNKFNEADEFINDNIDLLSAFEDRNYHEIKDSYIRKYRNTKFRHIMEEYRLLIRGCNFIEADNLVERNNEFIDLFRDNDYLQIKASYIIKYFLNNVLDNNKPYKLDKAQALAVEANDKDILVTARAGSGKTRIIVSKILYLLEKYSLNWDSIYVFAFNRNVPEEISIRLQRNIKLINDNNKYSKLNVTETFHKFAKDISGYKGKILGDEKKHYIKLVIEDLKENCPDFKEKVYSFFRNESNRIDKRDFKDPQRYYIYIRNLKYITLNGEKVKSIGEKWIADFLFENGIKYNYERSYYPFYIKENTLNVSISYEEKLRCLEFIKKGTDEIKPDFFLPQYRIVWEHWGINEDKDSNEDKEEFSRKFENTWEEYRKKKQWKIDFWKNWRKKYINPLNWALKEITEIDKMIETNIGDCNRGREEFEKHLKLLLINNGIKLIKRTKEELIKEVWDKSIDQFTAIAESFINRYQQEYFNDRDLFITKMNEYKDKPRVYSFFEIGLIILNKYEEQLKSDNKILRLKKYEQFNIDFNQLIMEAINNIKNGNADEYLGNIKWIIIDEYQDFSQLFYELINEIRKRNNEIKLFCVGDDWQAINRFAGSNVRYFEKFNLFFRGSKILPVTINYRSNKELVTYSNNFMTSNGFTDNKAKSIKTANNKSVFIEDVESIFIHLNVEKSNDDNDNIINNIMDRYGIKSNLKTKAQYIKKCIEIIKNNSTKNILILHRNNDFSHNMSLQNFYNILLDILVKENIYDLKESAKSKIQISTIHSSKGLEANVVIILEVIQGIIPTIHPNNELFEIFDDGPNVNLDDQIRLFYVALTRAKEKLFILTEESKKSDFLRFQYQELK